MILTSLPHFNSSKVFSTAADFVLIVWLIQFRLRFVINFVGPIPPTDRTLMVANKPLSDKTNMACCSLIWSVGRSNDGNNPFADRKRRNEWPLITDRTLWTDSLQVPDLGLPRVLKTFRIFQEEPGHLLVILFLFMNNARLYAYLNFAWLLFLPLKS